MLIVLYYFVLYYDHNSNLNGSIGTRYYLVSIIAVMYNHNLCMHNYQVEKQIRSSCKQSRSISLLTQSYKSASSKLPSSGHACPNSHHLRVPPLPPSFSIDIRFLRASVGSPSKSQDPVRCVCQTKLSLDCEEYSNWLHSQSM